MHPLLTLYTRDGCHLCEQAEDLVVVHAPNCQIVNVDADPILQRVFGLRVPVLAFGDRVLLEGRIDECELIQAMRSF